ncbi:MAG: hypothetical protein R3F14_10630 [Polyangiaceae bacterium]
MSLALASPVTLAMPKSRILTKSLSEPRVMRKMLMGLEIAANDAARVRGGEAVCGDHRGDVGDALDGELDLESMRPARLRPSRNP